MQAKKKNKTKKKYSEWRRKKYYNLILIRKDQFGVFHTNLESYWVNIFLIFCWIKKKAHRSWKVVGSFVLSDYSWSRQKRPVLPEREWMQGQCPCGKYVWFSSPVSLLPFMQVVTWAVIQIAVTEVPIAHTELFPTLVHSYLAQNWLMLNLTWNFFHLFSLHISALPLSCSFAELTHLAMLEHKKTPSLWAELLAGSSLLWKKTSEATQGEIRRGEKIKMERKEGERTRVCEESGWGGGVEDKEWSKLIVGRMRILNPHPPVSQLSQSGKNSGLSLELTLNNFLLSQCWLKPSWKGLWCIAGHNVYCFLQSNY